MNTFFLFFFLIYPSVGSTSILVVGGNNERKGDKFTTVEHFSKSVCQVPNLEKTIDDTPSVFVTPINNHVLVCGGKNNLKSCLRRKDGHWQPYNRLKMERSMSAVATTKHGSFIFGGKMSKTTYEYMPTMTKIWKLGKMNLPKGFSHGCAVTISEDEILLIGGMGRFKKVLIFNSQNHTFTKTKVSLQHQEQEGHRCSLLPNRTQVLINGGAKNITEIIDLKTLNSSSNIRSKKVKNSNHHRNLGGMGTMIIDNKPSLVVFGGSTWRKVGKKDTVVIYDDTFEKYDPDEDEWTILKDIKLKEARDNFGFATVKPSMICKNTSN